MGGKTVYELLTRREIKILRMLTTCDCTGQMIASKLKISYETVKTHRKNILRKTGQHNIKGLVKYALSQQLIETREVFGK